MLDLLVPSMFEASVRLVFACVSFSIVESYLKQFNSLFMVVT